MHRFILAAAQSRGPLRGEKMLIAGLRKMKSVAFSKKFGEYRTVFAVFSLVLLSGAFAGAVIWSGVTLTDFGESVAAALTQRLSSDESVSFFIRALAVFRPAALFFLVSFFFGITVYAPLIGFLSCLFFGICGGITLGLCSRMTAASSFGALFVTESLFFLLCGLALSAYCSFCACVCFKQNRLIPDREDRLFGGSLFFGDFFSEVNLRFCFMYFLVFLLFSVLLFLFACLRTLVSFII